MNDGLYRLERIKAKVDLGQELDEQDKADLEALRQALIHMAGLRDTLTEALREAGRAARNSQIALEELRKVYQAGPPQ
jgi:hypothetical protein